MDNITIKVLQELRDIIDWSIGLAMEEDIAEAFIDKDGEVQELESD